MSTTVDAEAKRTSTPKPKESVKKPSGDRPMAAPAGVTPRPSKPLEEEPLPPPVGPSPETIARAVRDVRTVLEEQREQSQTLTTKLNILFVANGALLTSLSVSRLTSLPSVFTVAEVVGFLVSFTLLVRAFLPRQVAVSPNLEDRKFLEKYLALSPKDYELQMLVNLAETYNANKQRLDDITQTLKYGAFATWSVACIILAHMLAHMIRIYFLR